MYSIKQLAQKIDATYIGEDKPFSGIHFDSRQIKPGDIFVAIVAERDGHEFIASAMQNGAAAVLVDHKIAADIPQIIVKDTTKGLGQLAKVWKSQFDLPVIGLTGSCGKTTTKEMLASVFKQMGKVAYTQGNFNNALGVPLTLFQLRQEHEYLIVEMGTNNPGEIPYLVSLVTPDISLITNIGACHTEGLKSLDGIMQEKGAIFNALSKSDGIAIINLDDARIAAFSAQLTCRKISYSKTNHQADIYLSEPPNMQLNFSQFTATIQEPYLLTPGSSFRGLTAGSIKSSNIDSAVKPRNDGGMSHYQEHKYDFVLNLFGLHQVENALSVIAVATAFGIEPQVIAKGLAEVQAHQGRTNLIKINDTLSVIDDCYNASFPSVISAIKSLDQSTGRKILVLSNMGEMGESAEKYHRLVGQCIHHASIDQVLLYGDQTLIRYIQEEAGNNTQIYQDKALLIADLKTCLNTTHTNTFVLVKGSHANKMEEVIQACFPNHKTR